MGFLNREVSEEKFMSIVLFTGFFGLLSNMNAYIYALLVALVSFLVSKPPKSEQELQAVKRRRK